MTANPRLGTVTDALERAHHASIHGSPGARSGLLDEQAELVRAILSRAQEAVRSWENWEAINDAFAPGSGTATALTSLDLHAIGAIRKALARDAVLGVFRLTDADRNDRLTLCKLAKWINDSALVDRLASRQWALDQGFPPALADAAATRNRQRIARLTSLLSTDWNISKPLDRELVRLREQVRPMRNQLAHALEPDTTNQPPTVDAVRRLLGLTLGLATDAALIWIGSAVDAKNFHEFARKSAMDFWGFAFEGVIAVSSKGQSREVAKSQPETHD